VIHGWRLLGVCLVALSVVGASGAGGQGAGGQGGAGSEAIVVAAGLDTPRGLALGPLGELYVADSGDASRPGSGRVVRIGADGVAAPVLTGAANLTAAPHGPTYIYGLSDIAVRGDGLLVTVGFGEEATVPNRLVSLDAAGNSATLFDLDRFERERDPDGRGVGSNATGVVVAPDGAVWVSDAGGNWAARLASDGSPAAVVAFPSVDGEEAVPTGLAAGPDGSVYVALLRCLAPTGGKGGVARMTSDGAYQIVATGLSMPIDVAFDAAGRLHVLEFAVDYAPNSGRLVRVGADGSMTVLVGALNYPTSLALTDSGAAYVAQMAGVAGGGPGTGRIVRFDLAGQ